ncbi:MAG: sialate O-acetylesterase [Bacteroidales bacterium]|nr:sialate O-acetylesterase [Bacteroidales bacterium]
MKTLLLILTLTLSHLFSDHAVFQQDAQAPVWGWGTPGAEVSVKASWNKKAVKTKVAADGSWRVVIATPKADGLSHSIVVKSGKESLSVNDIALGEVWICSGQSNMEMPVRGFGFQEVEGATEAIMAAPETASAVRVFDIKTWKRSEPEKDVDAAWELSGPGVAAKTSAVAYFFARRLTKSIGVPVGIIVNAWGGSRIEPWMTRETIEDAGLTEEELADIYKIKEDPNRWPETPELIWNGRVAPIVGYAAKGILWYQGCSNIGQKCYDKLQNAMVTMWRKAWGCGDLPFIYALLAPYEHGDADGRWRPFFVEGQMRTADAIPNAWYVCTETIGNKTVIHPAQKKEVADMMVMRALQSVYGRDCGINIEPTVPKDIEFGQDGVVKIVLSNTWSDLMSITARSITGFELAGEDRVFHLATAEVNWDGNTLLVRCPEVPNPVAVRYAWRNWMGANLAKSSGIPVPPFRSDNWEY